MHCVYAADEATAVLPEETDRSELKVLSLLDFVHFDEPLVALATSDPVRRPAFAAAIRAWAAT